jgi:hypothetical protein
VLQKRAAGGDRDPPQGIYINTARRGVTITWVSRLKKRTKEKHRWRTSGGFSGAPFVS